MQRLRSSSHKAPSSKPLRSGVHHHHHTSLSWRIGVPSSRLDITRLVHHTGLARRQFHHPVSQSTLVRPSWRPSILSLPAHFSTTLQGRRTPRQPRQHNHHAATPVISSFRLSRPVKNQDQRNPIPIPASHCRQRFRQRSSHVSTQPISDPFPAGACNNATWHSTQLQKQTFSPSCTNCHGLPICSELTPTLDASNTR